MTRKDWLNALDAAAAVSAGVHENQKIYEKFYERYRDEISGFPGIWQLCAAAGLALTNAGIEHSRLTGHTYEYIDAVDMLVRLILCHKGAQAPTDKDLAAWAAAAVRKHSY